MAYEPNYSADEHAGKLKIALAHADKGKMTDEDFEVICIEIVANVLHVPSTLMAMGMPEEAVNPVCNTATEQLMEHNVLAVKAVREALDNLEYEDKDSEHILEVIKAYASTLPLTKH